MTPLSYRYVGVQADGVTCRGAVRASDSETAARQLTALGIFPTDLRATRHSRIRVSPGDLAAGMRAIASLLEAGLPLDQGLRALEVAAPPAWARVVPALRTEIARGGSFRHALESSDLPLPAHVLAIIGAGEHGGQVAQASGSAARILESSAARKAALQKALAYPVLLVVAGGASIGLLTTMVLPQFATLLDDAGAQVPMLTRAVISIGGAARFVLPLGLVLAIVGWAAVVRIDPNRFHEDLHRVLLRVPIIGRIRRAAAVANAASTLAALLAAGMPLISALPLAADAMGDAALGTSLSKARMRVLGGSTLSAAVDAESALTPAAVRFIVVGEQTARLPDMLAAAAQTEDLVAVQNTHRALQLIEPTVILVFGFIVMIIAASLLQALYALRVP